MIPKVIHYCWFGEKDIPEKDLKCIESWKRYCPDFEIIKWDEHNYDVNKNEYMKQAYENKKWGFVPDYARVDIVLNYGGIYLDTDVEIIKPFDSLLNEKFFCGFEAGEKNEMQVNLGLGFGAEKGNDILMKIRDDYDNRSFVDNDGNLNLTASPFYTTNVLLKNGLVKTNKKQKFDNYTVYPVDYFSPKSYVDGLIRKTDNTYSIHHFNGSWKDQDAIDRHKLQQQCSRILGYSIGWKVGALLFIFQKKGFINGCIYIFKHVININT